MTFQSPVDQLSDELFDAGSTESTRHNKLLHLENQLLSLATQISFGLTGRTQDHLRRGLIRRHLMMQTCRIEVRNTTIDQSGPMNPYTVIQLSVYLNAYYLNLVGALDNLAWAVVSALELRAEFDEDDFATQRFCRLSSSDFQLALSARSPAAAEAVQDLSEWMGDLRRFRDPAAHRLPLTVISAVLNEEQATEHSRLNDEANTAARQGDLGKYFELRRTASRLGSFWPVLEEPRGPQGEFHIAPNQIAFDQERFLWLAPRLIDLCLKPIANSIPTQPDAAGIAESSSPDAV